MGKQLIVSLSPYMRNGETAHCLMFDIYIALIPIIAVSTFFYGFHALLIILLSVFSAVATELLIQLCFKSSGTSLRTFLCDVMTFDEITIMDGSAIVTGLLLAFTLPPSVPVWIPVVGSIVAISVGKHVFGGLGYNIFNPALIGRAFLLAAWPAIMTSWKLPLLWLTDDNQAALDAVSAATPLALMKIENQSTPLLDLIVGNTGGSIGETSAVAILIGAAYLLYKGTITWHIPFSYMGTVFFMALVLGQDPLFHLFSGGLMLGAFFMATDVVTSPVTKSGRLIFGCGAGLITIIIRQFGGYPEGVCYSILLMNSLSPLIEKCTVRKYKVGEIKIPLIKKLKL